ncbi:MAG: PH domain-containing protein [Nostoc sp.]|uniref:PH domain-containing protein n=1 Tax=Nostoc sp. TaxID=1180 RepID=UPI002FEF9B28
MMKKINKTTITSQAAESGILNFHPSLVQILVENFLLHLLLIFLFWTILPLPYFYWKYIQIRSTNYILTTQRLITKSGVFWKEVNFIELYRVLDIQVERGPLYQLLDFGRTCLGRKPLLLGDIRVFSSDYSHPKLFLYTIPNALEVAEKIRKAFNDDKDIKRVIRRD